MTREAHMPGKQAILSQWEISQRAPPTGGGHDQVFVALAVQHRTPAAAAAGRQAGEGRAGHEFQQARVRGHMPVTEWTLRQADARARAGSGTHGRARLPGPGRALLGGSSSSPSSGM